LLSSCSKQIVHTRTVSKSVIMRILVTCWKVLKS
jgi:hypothetical protein